MMKRSTILFSLFVGVGMLFMSCDTTTEDSNDNDETAEQMEQEECIYSYDNASSTIGFTAYKFTEKVGVGGTFSDFDMTEAIDNENPFEVIKSLHVTIPVSNTDTKDEERDAKIVKYFFETAGIETITGSVTSVDEESNEAVFTITMNEITNNVEGTYSLENNVFSFEGEINVEDWEAANGIEKLNEECNDLHIGEDGVSKLWPDVKVTFETTLAIECD